MGGPIVNHCFNRGQGRTPKMKLLSLTISLFLALGCEGAKSNFKTCKDVPLMKGFEAEKYLGRWYQYSAYIQYFNLFDICTNADYSDASTDNQFIVGVSNNGVNKFSGEKHSVKGQAVLAHPDDESKPAELIVNFDSNPVKFNETNYSVAKTDYEHYSIVYTCKDDDKEEDGSAKIKFLWVLTRERNIAADVAEKIYKDIEDAGFDTKPLLKTKQTGCPE